MNPTVEAAAIASHWGLLGVAIGVAGTAIVGLAGIYNTRKAAERAVLAAQSRRVWDRKADAYQDALAAALWRQERRTYLASRQPTDAKYAEAAHELVARQTEQDWWDMQGRIGTFGAPKVVEAHNKSLSASDSARSSEQAWRYAREAVQSSRSGEGVTTTTGPSTIDPEVQTAAQALGDFQKAMGAAADADKELECQIRKDLQLEALMSPGQS